ncbi:MAG: PPC domain-containing protein [Pirellulales bacterium]|nr:PPC domain-containing protein [Pirellulales bacterium]
MVIAVGRTPKRLRIQRPALLAAIICFLGAAPVAAQLPATRITAIFPAGGRAGAELDLTITAGIDLEGVNQLQFTHPGITATQKTQAVEGQPQPQPVANQFHVTIAADVPPGMYELRAVGAYGISNPKCFAIGDRAETLEVEPNQAAEQATEIPINSWANGRAEPAKDVDWFRFTATKGARLIIDAWAERVDSRMDVSFDLYDAQGHLLDSGREFNHHDALFDFAVPTDGEYRLKVFDHQYRGGPDYTYRISISSAPYIDFVFPPAVQSGVKTPVTIYGRNLPGGQPTELGSADGRPLEMLAVELELPADEATRQRLALDVPIEPPSAALDGVNYRLSGPAGTSNPVLVSFATAPIVLEQEPNADPPQVVTPPCECMGQFAQLADLDVFSFNGKKDEVYWIEIYSQRLGVPADPLLVIQQVTKNEKGEPQITELKAEDDAPANVGGQAFNTAAGDPVFRLACPADAEYRVAVRDLYSETRAHPALVYRLAIRRESPDFRLVALAEFPINGLQAPQPWTNLLRKGGTDTLRVFALRQDGFGGEITVTVEGLPDGVSCPPAVIGPGQPSTSLVFTSTEGAADWTGPLHLVGKAKIGDVEISREVRPATVRFTAVNQPGISRLAHDVSMSVAHTAPYLLSCATPQIGVPQSAWIKLPLAATRRGDFAGALALTAVNLPGNVQNEAITVAADQKEAALYLFAQPDAPPGAYTIYVQSTTQVPFTKAADGSNKQPVNVVDASTPITISIAPGPLTLAAAPPAGGAIKQGATIEVPVKITRRNGFAGPVTLGLYLPDGTVGISAAAVAVAADQVEGKLVIQAAADAAEGARAHVAVQAQVDIGGQPVVLHQPIPIVVQK